jgi:mycothiol synthase
VATDLIRLRPYHPNDAAQVTQLINYGANLVSLAHRAVVDGEGRVRLQRYVPPSSECVVAIGDALGLVGYAYLAEREPRLVFETGAFARPGEAQAETGATLLTWAEYRARQRAGPSAAGLRALVQTNLFETEQDALARTERCGFVRVRDWLHMRLSLISSPTSPSPPPGLSLRPMDLDADWNAVGPALEASFADHWGTVVLREPPEPADAAPNVAEAEDESYSNAPGLCFIVWEGPQVVGGVLCNAKLVSGELAGRIGSLFVRPEWRRRGVGRTLALAALGAFWNAGLREVVLDTDAKSLTSAPEFYRSLGFAPERLEHLFEKELRPGREARYLGPPG